MVHLTLSSLAWAMTASANMLTISTSTTRLYSPSSSISSSSCASHTASSNSSSSVYPAWPSSNATAATNFTTFTAIPYSVAYHRATRTLSPSRVYHTETPAPSAAVRYPANRVWETFATEAKVTGRPSAFTFHCGVHGLPKSGSQIVQYWEDSRGEEVTLGGCYELCAVCFSDFAFLFTFFWLRHHAWASIDEKTRRAEVMV